MNPTRVERFWLYLPLALVLIPFLIGPIVFGFLASFTNYAPLQSNLQFVGLKNYAAVTNDNELRTAFRNAVAFVSISVPAELALGFSIAYLMRRPFRGRRFLRIALLLPWLVSPVASGVMWHFLFNADTGLFNFFIGLTGLTTQPSPLGIHGLAMPAFIATDIWRKAPLVCFLLLPGLLAIPSEQWEQATLDGTSVWQRIRAIALPWLYPLLLTIGLLLIGDALGTYETVLIMTGGGPASDTLLPALFSFQQAFQIHLWTIGATSAWLIVAAMLLVGAIYLALVRREIE